MTLLQGKVAVVTGGSRGIGRAVAFAMAAAGANVALLYANREEEAAATAAAIGKTGAQAAYYRCDVADQTAVESTVRAILADFGGVDILVNNAGFTRDNLLIRMDSADFDEVLAVHLRGTFHMIQQLYGHFAKKRGGRIINITSVAGLTGNAGQANYAAAKAGLIGLTKTVAKELAGRNVTCNAIAPGFIATEMTEILAEGVKNRALEAIPMRRMGSPEEVAGLAVFLASEAAAYITGEVIRVDGGLAM